MLKTCASTSSSFPQVVSNPEMKATVKDSKLKYAEFLQNQNNTIAKLLVGGFKGSESILNSLQDQTVNFIKSILQELSDSYTKHRIYKSETQQQIQLLKQELLHEQQKYEQLKSQFYSGWEENTQKSTVIINFLQKQLKMIANSSEQKIATMINRLQKKQIVIQDLVRDKQILSEEIQELNRVLRQERHYDSEKHLQLKGMEALIAEYQDVFSSYERNISDLTSKLLTSEARIKKLEEYNIDLQKQLDKLQQKQKILAQVPQNSLYSLPKASHYSKGYLLGAKTNK